MKIKHVRKRLVCKNRSNHALNVEAMDKIKSRYIRRMEGKGWTFCSTNSTSGNAFFQFETYISLYKPNWKNKDHLDFCASLDIERVVNKAKQKNLSNDGIFVMCELKKLGWKSLSYTCSKDIISNITYTCGYSGCYQQAKLVKVFK